MILLEEIWGLLEDFSVILEGLRVLLENWAELAGFDWRLHEISGEKIVSGTFIRRNFALLENLGLILENREVILDNREHLLEKVRDILEVRKFIRTNKNILELFRIY